MALEPLNIQIKQDNAQKVEQTAGLPSDELLNAEEVNKMVYKINELINRTGIDYIDFLELYNNTLTNQ